MSTRNRLTGAFLAIAVVTEGAIALSASRPGNVVTVVARGPAGLRIEGKGAAISLEEDASAFTFRVPLAPLDTGLAVRDLQVRQMLEADTWPTAILRVQRSALTFPKEQVPVDGMAEAELTLRGQSRPVQVRYRAQRAHKGVTKIQGSFQLDLRDFDIRAPSYLGVSVAPKVEVRAELALNGA